MVQIARLAVVLGGAVLAGLVVSEGRRFGRLRHQMRCSQCGVTGHRCSFPVFTATFDVAERDSIVAACRGMGYRISARDVFHVVCPRCGNVWMTYSFGGPANL